MNTEEEKLNTTEKPDVISNVAPIIDNSKKQSFPEKIPSKEKIKLAEKTILDSLGIESDSSLNNFDELLETATKSLPRYQEIEKELKTSKNEELPYELFKILKSNSDKAEVNESAPRDGVLIKSMKEGHLECAGRTLIASTFLQEHELNHTVVSAPGHAFLLIEQSPETLVYFDANNNLYFTFPRSALEGYEDLNKSSECHLKEYTPRETDFYDGLSTVFPDFVSMPAKEGLGRQYLGNVAAAFNGNKEFAGSYIAKDKEACGATHQIEEKIYGRNRVLETYYSRVEELIKQYRIQRDDDRKVINEIIKSCPEHDDFISFFTAILDGNIGTRLPYIKNSSREQKIAFAERAWNSFGNKDVEE